MGDGTQGKVLAQSGTTGPLISTGCKILLLALPSAEEAASPEMIERICKEVQEERDKLKDVFHCQQGLMPKKSPGMRC